MAESSGGVGRLLPSLAAASGLCAIAILGAVHLWFPLHGDQAFLLVGAKLMAQGGVLYRDFWDVKQPGVFIFYEMAGQLFGFDERGLHLFELLYLLGFGVVILWCMRMTLRTRVALALSPVLAIGTYYATAQDWHLSQLEVLVGLPTFLSACLVCARGERRTARLFLAGIAGGAVAVFKLALIILPATAWAVALVAAYRTSSPRRCGPILQSAVTLLVGASLPLAACAAFFAWHGLLATFAWTNFQFPFLFAASEKSVHHYPSFRNPSVLLDSLRWFGFHFGPLALLAAVGARDVVRRRNLQGMVLVAWVGAAGIAICIQTWWQYHFLLLIPGIGLLAAAGVDVLATSGRAKDLLHRFPAAALVAVALMVGPLAKPLAHKLIALATNRFACDAEWRWRYQSAVSRHGYAQVFPEVAFLRSPDSIPGRIYVDNPLYLYASGRMPALPISVWSYLLPQQREWIPAALVRVKPAYMKLDEGTAVAFDAATPGFQTFLASQYRPLEGKCGWFVRCPVEGCGAPASEQSATP